MGLRPRFSPGTHADRPFVDREAELDLLAAGLSKADDGPSILNITGVGGIGKSRLLDEFRRTAADTHRTAYLDLQIPSLRQQELALASLRGELGRQGARFDRFDVAYATLWQRLNPHLRLSHRDLPLVNESEILTSLADSAAGLPAVGTAVALIRAAERAARGLRQWRHVREDRLLKDIDDLPVNELVDAVTYFFAKDLNESVGKKGCRYVVLVDSYEALFSHAQRDTTHLSVDGWLRDLCAQLSSGLVVLASREPVAWSTIDPEWDRHVSLCPLSDLPFDARLALLDATGLKDPEERRTIAQASRGLPFYLQLAADTWRGGTSLSTMAAVSQAQILERFLKHVGRSEMKILELLSLARTFDREVYESLAKQFDLPSNELAWEALVGYSFVTPADTASRYQLHQVMVEALRARLPARVTSEVHGLLFEIWKARSTRLRDLNTGMHGHAVREAIYHGSRAGRLSSASLLEMTDQLAAIGSWQELAGTLHDFEELIQEENEHVNTGILQSLRCIRAEVANLRGNPEDALEITATINPEATRPVRERTAIARAHARRIVGATDESAIIYRDLWRAGQGRQRLVAGTWVADIDMVQGRFRSSIETAGEVTAQCSDTDLEIAGDAERLLCLAYRFQWLLDESWEHLHQARLFYEQAGSAIGLANIMTNEIELAAVRTPGSARAIADRALEAQEAIGSQLEIGKIHTALAQAELLLDRTSAADAALERARNALTRARYRSGLARAKLIEGFVYAREGLAPQAMSTLLAAVDELKATHVYPTLVVGAGLLARRLGYSMPSLEEDVSMAVASIDPMDGFEALLSRLDRAVAAMLGSR